jgi:hypothetical protein
LIYVGRTYPTTWDRTLEDKAKRRRNSWTDFMDRWLGYEPESDKARTTRAPDETASRGRRDCDEVANAILQRERCGKKHTPADEAAKVVMTQSSRDGTMPKRIDDVATGTSRNGCSMSNWSWVTKKCRLVVQPGLHTAVGRTVTRKELPCTQRNR